MIEFNNNFESQVMRRVYLIYWYRRMTNPVTLKLSGLAAFGSLVFTLISVRNVVANISRVHGPWAMFKYLLTSFTKTDLSVQTIIVAGSILMVIVAKDILGQTRFPSYLRYVR
jgi:hypothetical protein